MQLTIQRNLLQQIAAISLERRAKIVNRHAAQLRHQPVGATRRNAAQPKIINALFAPSADNVIAFGNLFEK